MKKEVKEIFGEKKYLLGTNYNNEKVWLVEPTWEFERWIVGFVTIYNKQYSGIDMYTNFDSYFIKDNVDAVNNFKSYFKETTLDRDSKIWQLIGFMQTLYALKSYADMLLTGGIHMATGECSELIKNDTERDRINQVLIPKVWEKVAELLSGESD